MDLDAVGAVEQEMGKDAYLQMLTTQLQNQDPLKPVSNEDFIADLAQFTSVEQMTNMNDNLETLVDAVTKGEGLQGGSVSSEMLEAQMGTWQLGELRAAGGMIGRNVTFADPEAQFEEATDGDKMPALTERVNSVVLEDGVVWLKTDNYKMNITDVLEITA